MIRTLNGLDSSSYLKETIGTFNYLYILQKQLLISLN